MAVARILAVDDHVPITSVISRSLGRFGFDVTAANTFADAKTVLTGKRRFDAVFLDLNLGDGRGEDLIPFIDGEPRPATIVLSGELDADRVMHLSDQCDLILPKPFNADTLVHAVWRTTQNGRLAQVVATYSQAHKLTNQEQQVGFAAAEGLSAEETSDRLGCCPNTLRTHWQRIREKTGCATKTAVLAALLHHVLGHHARLH